MPKGSPLNSHVNEFNKVCDALEIIDEEIDDKGKTILLVSSLPLSYSNFADALMYGR